MLFTHSRISTRTVVLLVLALTTCAGLAGGRAYSSANAKATKTIVNFQNPKRNYVAVSGKARIYVEKSLVDSKPELSQRGAAKLTAALVHIFEQLPKKSATELSSVNFYLMWGVDAPQGGRASSMGYVRKGEPKNYPNLDPQWEHAVVIYSVVNLMYLDDLWTRKALMHELAHAWHLTHWPDKYPKIYEPWQHAKYRKLYHQVMDYTGKIVAVAYASTNPLEYFAELSAMYFVGGNYVPMNRQGLQSYDHEGYAMVESLWAIGSR